jgi:hypothetical protein
MQNLIGGCLCGDIKYEVHCDSSQFFSYSCHCRDCQYITGGPPNSAIYIPKPIALTKGEPHSYISKSDTGTEIMRFFCGRCGTHLFGTSERYPGTIVIKVGSLDDPSIFKSKMNVWVSSAQPWHHIDPDLLKYDKAPT